MMPRIARTTAVLVVLACVGAGPLHAQEADTTAADTTTTDPTAAEAAPDTTGNDTTDMAAPPSDTTAADTTRMAAADTMRTRADSLRAARRDSIEARQDSILAARRDSAAALREAAETAAQSAAEEWLALTDAGKFDESWQAADSTLQNGISREKWIDQGRRVRGRLDSVRTRRLVRAQYRDSTGLLPGGRPVVLLKYKTEFDQGTTLEAVVTTRPDTTWKVAGYRVVVAPPSAADSTSVDTARTEETP